MRRIIMLVTVAVVMAVVLVLNAGAAFAAVTDGRALAACLESHRGGDPTQGKARTVCLSTFGVGPSP